MKKLIANWQFLFFLWLASLGIVFLLVGNANGFMGATITAVFGLLLMGIIYVMTKSAGRYDA